MGVPFKAWIIAPGGTGVGRDLSSVRSVLEGLDDAHRPQDIEQVESQGFVTAELISTALTGDLGVTAFSGRRIVWIVGDAERDPWGHWRLRTDGDDGVRLSDIWEALAKAAGAEAPLIAFIDVCHAGPPLDLELPQGLVVFAACQQGEKALASEADGGWMTQYIVKCLGEATSTLFVDALARLLMQNRPGTQKPFIHIGDNGRLSLSSPLIQKCTTRSWLNKPMARWKLMIAFIVGAVVGAVLIICSMFRSRDDSNRRG